MLDDVGNVEAYEFDDDFDLNTCSDEEEDRDHLQNHHPKSLLSDDYSGEEILGDDSCGGEIWNDDSLGGKIWGDRWGILG